LFSFLDKSFQFFLDLKTKKEKERKENQTFNF